MVESVTSTDVPPQIRIYQLQYVKVNVAGVECNALNDSGYQIPVHDCSIGVVRMRWAVLC